MRSVFSILGALLIGAGIFLCSSCKQDDRDYIVTVYVTVDDTIPVRNATVRMFAPVDNTIVDVTHQTNAEGYVRFSFKAKAYLDVHVVKGSYRKCTSVELERGEQDLDVNIYPFRDPRRTCL